MGKKPLRFEGGYPVCEKCFEKMTEPCLAEALASVGIEHGKSSGQMLVSYLTQYHERGHEEKK